MVDLGGYVIILVETRDKRVRLYGKNDKKQPSTDGLLWKPSQLSSVHALGIPLKKDTASAYAPYLKNLVSIEVAKYFP